MKCWEQLFIQTGPDGSAHYRRAMASCTEALAAVFESARGPYSGLAPAELRRRITDRSLDHADIAPLDTVIKEVAEDIARHAIIVQHPHCIAHLHPPPLISGMAAETFISAQNQSMDSWDQSASATYVEQHVVERLCKMFGYPDAAGGVFTSGGTQGNIMGLLVARDWFVRKHSGHDVQADGLPEYGSKLRIVGSAASHVTLEKAAALMGLGRHAVVRVATGDDGTLLVDVLQRTLRELRDAGLLPFVIVGTAGTTDHGAVDDLRRIGNLARQHDIWFHVDAAYGGALVLSQARQRLAGIELADSVIIDFHKLWFQPISCGALLMRDGADFRYLLHRADYLNRASDELPNLVDKTISTTRRFDALKVYMMFRVIGTATLGAMIDHLMRQTAAIAGQVDDSADFELLAPPSLSTVLFRYVFAGADARIDTVNRELRVALLTSGVAVLGETITKGKVALKLTILNPCVPTATLATLFDHIRDQARALVS